MSGSFTQIYVQFIFAVGNKDCLISKDWEDKLIKHISGFLRDGGNVPIVLKASHDHIHVFSSIKPTFAIESLAEQIKNDSAAFINSSGWLSTNFSWQSGYGAFTYSKTRTNDVYLYIMHQERYHAKKTFREEFIEFLRLSAVDYDPNELPKGVEEFSMVMDQ